MTMKTVEASETAKKRKRDFIAKATQKYGEGTYSYDRCDYILSHIKVIITCPTHGDFEQTPNRHIYCNTTISCPKCKHKPEETIPRITTLPDWLHFAKDDCVISDTRVARILHISVTQLRAMVELTSRAFTFLGASQGGVVYHNLAIYKYCRVAHSLLSYSY